jgi:hypothetical protein
MRTMIIRTLFFAVRPVGVIARRRVSRRSVAQRLPNSGHTEMICNPLHLFLFANQSHRVPAPTIVFWRPPQRIDSDTHKLGGKKQTVFPVPRSTRDTTSRLSSRGTDNPSCKLAHCSSDCVASCDDAGVVSVDTHHRCECCAIKKIKFIQIHHIAMLALLAHLAKFYDVSSLLDVAKASTASRRQPQVRNVKLHPQVHR